MANETTTSTLDDLTNATMIEPYLVAALSEKPGLFRHCKEFNLVGKEQQAAKIPSETSWWGSANDDGASLDTEFDATVVTDISNSAVSTGSVTCTPAEYGVAIELEDKVQEDSISGIDFLNLIQERMLHVMTLAFDDDFLALFAGLSNSIGSTGVDMTLANLLQGITDLRVRGVDAPDGLHITLDNQAASDVEGVMIATSTSAAVYAMAADRHISWNPSPDAGVNPNRYYGSIRNVPITVSGLTDTANTAADVVSGIYVPSSAANDTSGHVTFGCAWKRLPRFETERHAKKRTTDLVMTSRLGFVELLDGSGSKYVTDA